jgi:hypothetical protein
MRMGGMRTRGNEDEGGRRAAFLPPFPQRIWTREYPMVGQEYLDRSAEHRGECDVGFQMIRIF